MSQQSLARIALLIAGLLWVYLFVRAFTVPPSHDEAVTYLLYVQGGNFLPHVMIWDANNHLLNSALSYLLTRFMGFDMWVLRLPNLLLFPLYALMSWKLSRLIDCKLTSFTCFIALLTPTLLLEFFAQTRGYGLSMAFFLPAIYCLIQFCRKGSTGMLIGTCVAMALTLSANMSVMTVYMLVLGMLGWELLQRACMARVQHSPNYQHMQWLHLLLWGLLPFAAATAFAFAMKSGGLLYYGEKDGFITVTVRTLSRYVLFDEREGLLLFLASAGGASALLLTASGFARGKRDAGFVVGSLLLGSAIGAIALCHLLDVNFPEDRTGLFFVPLFVLSFAFALDFLRKHVPYSQYLSLMLLAIPVQTAMHANLGYTALWRELHLHHSLYERMTEDASAQLHPADNSLEGYRLLASSWGYHRLRAEQKLPPLTPRRNGAGRSDYAICYSGDCERYSTRYDTLASDPRNDVHLLKRKEIHRPAEIAIPADGVNYTGSDHYINMWESRDAAMLDTLDAVYIKASISTSVKHLPMDFIISADDVDGNHHYYDMLPINWVYSEWDGREFEAFRYLDLPPNTGRIIVYFWNLRDMPCSVELEEFRAFSSAASE